jgi:iron-sulfur cluster repair protein YtfE (RIC family)
MLIKASLPNAAQNDYLSQQTIPPMTALTEPLQRHHKHCDDMFAAAEAAVADKDWELSEPMFVDFQTELETHFCTEEEVLFPAFEASTGISAGPTRMMRFEHVQMRDLMEQMRAALDERNDANFAGAAETLLILMQQHNIKEENILYPMCDRSLAAQDDTLGAVLSERLETACRKVA